MSAILIVRRDRKEISRHELTGTTYDIGRSRQGDILLEDDEVSRKHCTLTVQDGAYVIADAGSRNGIAVNGALAQEPVTLKDGDEITVGPFDLTFHAEGAAGEPGGAEDDDASTRFVSQKELKKTLPGKQVVEGDTQDPVRVKLELLEGPLKGAVYQNWSGDLTIGRGLDNHVVLVDDAVSIYHARIYRVGDDFYVEDLGSSNGSFLRGVRCTKEKLRNKDSIRIGTTTMAFTRTDLRAQKKVRKLAIMASGVALLLVLLVSLLTPDDRAELTAQRGYAAYNEK
ncbi:MAG: FHA domain-containing protein, partial [Kiritimatiellae bacterium]|nr:FHA domain-containing protein [Kiritimatiellia bacterium]